MANYQLTVRTLSPLHIGTGLELRNMFDYVVNKNQTQTGRLNTEKILEDKFDPKKPDALPGELIRNDVGNPAYYRYILSGAPKSTQADSRLRECVKDVYDIPYIPGSSIKGAMRTAFGAKLLSESNLTNDIIDLSDSPKYMDNDLEEKLFGKDSYNDLFRALFISDAKMADGVRDPKSMMEVYNTNPITLKKTNSSVPIELECIKGQLDFYATVKIDDYVLEKNNFPHKDLLTNQLMPIIKKHSEKRLHQLRDWYKDVDGAEKISSFLNQLIGFSEGKLEKIDNMALMQMGFGTGWDGMTYSDWLKQDDYFYENLKQKHLYRKQSKGRTNPREPGMPFPSSRKVVMKNEKPVLPLGWVMLTLEPRE